MPSITLTGAVGEFAASRHGVLSQHQAASFGVSATQLQRLQARGALREVAPGVYVVAGSPPTWRQHLMVASLLSRAVGVIDTDPAAALHGVDGFAPDATPASLLLPSRRRLAISGIVQHVGPMDECDLTTVDHIRCTTVERTICDLGSTCPEWMVAIAFEWYWRSHGDLDPLRSAVERLHRPGQAGTKIVRELLVDARMKGRATESALELRLERLLSDIDGLVRQFEVVDDEGRFVARVDFAIPERRIAIEAHSRQFHSAPEAVRRDELRHQALVQCGWTVRYVTAMEMRHPSQLQSSIRALVAGFVQPTFPHVEW